MVGNVREWCLDWYSETAYQVDAGRFPAGPETGEKRVVRGGSYSDRDRFFRSSHRGYWPPETVVGNQGFRVVVDALKVKAPKLSVHYTPTEYDNTRDASLGNATIIDPATIGASFSYKFNGKSYNGSVEQGAESELVFYDSNDSLLSLMINNSTSTVVSSRFGVTDGRLHLGAGKENITLQMTFFLEEPPKKGPTRFLPSSRDALGDDSDVVRGLVTATYLRPGPTYKTHWFGKPASSVPKEKQEMVFFNARYPVVGFGIPFNIETSPENDCVLYADFSPSGQLAQIRKHIANKDLKFVIGDRTLQIDESARRTLYLVERAVAVLRYRQGARVSASRPTLGD
jgi:hypothetical protein